MLASIFLLEKLSSAFANGSLSPSIKLTRFSTAPTFPVHSGATSLTKFVALSSDWSHGLPPRLIPSSNF